jgi:hypothetical protein
MTKRPTIRFSIDPDQKKEIEEYAKIKGFDNCSNLARRALFNYIVRNPIRTSKRATALKSEKGL